MNKKIGAVLVIFILFLGGVIIGRSRQVVTPVPNTLAVTATFYPLAEFARQVGGASVQVQTLVPAGTEPHDFEPSTQDIAQLHHAQVYVYNGAGFEGWLDKVLPDLQKNGVKTVNASAGLTLMPADPHLWLDPVLAQQQVKTIAASFSQVDPTHATTYQQQAANYLTKLQQLDQEFRTGLANCQTRTIVTSHAAFGYLAKEYQLNVITIAGLSPDQEPSPQRLAEIVQQVKTQQIKYIFFESLVKPTLADTIATETGAQTLVFNPLEGLTSNELAAGKEYISIQQQNLQNLRIALSCQ